MKTPRAIELAITNKCNLRCKYCSYFTSAGDIGHDLPKEEWLKFFTELNRCAVTDVTISGGEAFCRDDLTEIIKGIVCNRMRFKVLSNGTLITYEIADFLASTGRCDGVQVSIDGSVPTTHDAFRGKGNFMKAINGIRILQKYNVSVLVRVTIHRENVRDLEGIAKLLLDEVGLPSFSTNSTAYMGLCKQNTQQVQLTVEEHSLAMKTLLILNKKYNGRISAAAGPLANARSWLEMEKARKEGAKFIPGRGYLVSCGGVMDRLGVRADGIIIPCIQLNHVELGRINQDDLQDIWRNHPELNRLRERRNIPLSNFKSCQGCDYVNYCAGGCPALSYTIEGNLYHPNPDSCLRVFLEQGGMLPDEDLLFRVIDAGG